MYNPLPLHHVNRLGVSGSGMLVTRTPCPSPTGSTPAPAGKIASPAASQSFVRNIVRRSGANIAAAEIEECLAVHPKVKQAAVLAVAHELREEEVMACVVEGAEPIGADLAGELFGWSRERLAYFKGPAWRLFRQDLPVTTSQRVRKIQIFPPGVDSRPEPGVIDLRGMKKAPGRAAGS